MVNLVKTVWGSGLGVFDAGGGNGEPLNPRKIAMWRLP